LHFERLIHREVLELSHPFIHLDLTVPGTFIRCAGCTVFNAGNMVDATFDAGNRTVCYTVFLIAVALEILRSVPAQSLCDCLAPGYLDRREVERPGCVRAERHLPVG